MSSFQKYISSTRVWYLDMTLWHRYGLSDALYSSALGRVASDCNPHRTHPLFLCPHVLLIVNISTCDMCFPVVSHFLFCSQYNYSAIDTYGTGQDPETEAHGNEDRSLRRQHNSSASVDHDGYAIPHTNDRPVPRGAMGDGVYSVPSGIDRDGRTIVRDGRYNISRLHCY